jgi:hypothetical protein
VKPSRRLERDVPLDLGKDDRATWTLHEQAAVDRIAAAGDNLPLPRLPAVRNGAGRTNAEQAELERPISQPHPHETACELLDLASVGATQLYRSRDGEGDHRRAECDALLTLDRAVARLVLPRFPTVHPTTLAAGHQSVAAVPVGPAMSFRPVHLENTQREFRGRPASSVSVSRCRG